MGALATWDGLSLLDELAILGSRRLWVEQRFSAAVMRSIEWALAPEGARGKSILPPAFIISNHA
ncbi:MAG: hypothetical protein NVS1B11_33030 [Terriglobales bacterium]